ncbi:MAG: hypothetical protein D6732_21815 [Methanobacteriota archaeon]|nr:MAG: hypothetical protein D6732_21815 [Euryarchaeota archaeon]
MSFKGQINYEPKSLLSFKSIDRVVALNGNCLDFLREITFLGIQQGQRRKGQSISGTMFKASVLRNELKGVIPNHAAHLNESVYLHALSTAVGHRHRLTIAKTVAKQLTPLRYTELLLFGQTDKLISVIVDQFNYSSLGAKIVLKGMAKRMRQLTPVTITSSVILPDPKDFANALH